MAVDGEIVALESGRPNFNLLQNFHSAASSIHYFIFDLLVWNDRELTKLPLVERRRLLKSLKLRSARIRVSERFKSSANDMVAAARQQGLEGVIAKRQDSLYESGKRTGAWVKYRVNRGQEFVIGGYIPGPYGLDSLMWAINAAAIWFMSLVFATALSPDHVGRSSRKSVISSRPRSPSLTCRIHTNPVGEMNSLRKR